MDFTPTAIDASDTTGHSFNWTLVSRPVGMTINPQTGEILWKVDGPPVEAGKVSFTVQVVDGFGQGDTKTYTVPVTNNGLIIPPDIFNFPPPAYAVAGQPYNWSPEVIDPQGDLLQYNIFSATLSNGAHPARG